MTFVCQCPITDPETNYIPSHFAFVIVRLSILFGNVKILKDREIYLKWIVSSLFHNLGKYDLHSNLCEYSFLPLCGVTVFGML